MGEGSYITLFSPSFHSKRFPVTSLRFTESLLNDKHCGRQSAVMRSQAEVTAYFSSKQLLLFAISVTCNIFIFPAISGANKIEDTGDALRVGRVHFHVNQTVV